MSQVVSSGSLAPAPFSVGSSFDSNSARVRVISSALKGEDGSVSNVLTTDFCPWANRYVYWLKEPIGWFVVALGVSVLIGMHVSPLGWVLASAVAGIVAVGMLWPWIAVRAAGCRLSPAVAEVHENEACDLVFSVRNRLPIPLWGLAVEGYLDREGDAVRPTVALACVPPMSEADYRLAVRPELRGHYPIVAPMVACSFPFGIWTARREIIHRSPLVVFPQVSMIQDEATLTGGRMSECGDGLRAGQMGEHLGVREFRSGDRLRNVHWVHTARTGQLVVCERGGPQQQTVEVIVDTESLCQTNPVSREANRATIAWRVRVAASIVNHLHARHVPVTLRLGRQAVHGTAGPMGLRRMLLELASVPTDGTDDCQGQSLPSANPNCVSLLITSDEVGATIFVDQVGVDKTRGANGNGKFKQRACISLERDVASQLLRFWRGVERAQVAA
jgi:uncharacterized protein (DUF58 family)